jgi:hypothetical protein
MCGDTVAVTWHEEAAAGPRNPVAAVPGRRERGSRHAGRSPQSVVLVAAVALLLFAAVPARAGSVPADGAGSASGAAGPGFVIVHTGPGGSPAPSAEPTAPARIPEVAQETPPPAAQSTAQPTPAQRPVTAPIAASGPTPAPALFHLDLYESSLVRYQDPDRTACTAAATMMMLNFTSARGDGGSGFAWTQTVAYDTQEGILAWERANDTLQAGSPGSDPHGWRNALNKYGWQDWTDVSTMHYEDASYSSLESAVKASVQAIARFHRPVGILAWSGSHAQIMTGYDVYGADPASSSAFTVADVYLTDPLVADGLRDTKIDYSGLAGGPSLYRFTTYTWRDSPYDDPYEPGNVASYLEWYGKWVVILPVVGAGPTFLPLPGRPS